MVCLCRTDVGEAGILLRHVIPCYLYYGDDAGITIIIRLIPVHLLLSAKAHTQ